jgi:putative transposase
LLAEVQCAVKAMGLTAVRTSIRNPWQNGVAERWVGSCRRDLLDHVVPLNERHLRRLLSVTELLLYAVKSRIIMVADVAEQASKAAAGVGRQRKIGT